MSVKHAVVARFIELCNQRNITPNHLANLAGLTPSTVYSMLDNRRHDISIVTIKKLCDGLDITLGEFFSTPEFDNWRNRRSSKTHIDMAAWETYLIHLGGLTRWRESATIRLQGYGSMYLSNGIAA